MKILLAAPDSWVTDALCGMLKKLSPAPAIERVADPHRLPLSGAAPADLILLDVDVAADAPAAVAAAAHRFPPSPVVAVGMPRDNAAVESFLAAGALGYLSKNLAAGVALGMLRMITGGIDGTAGPGPLPRSGKNNAELPLVQSGDAADPALEFGLTRRQTEVLALASEGKPNQAIAKKLGITEGVVKLHMTAIFKALKVRNRIEAALMATRLASVNFRQIRQAESGRLDLDWLLAHMTHRHLAPQTVLFKRDDPGGELYYLQQGRIRLLEIGVEMTSGAMFGEIGIFSADHKRTATAICATEVDIFTLTSDQVKRLYLLNPQFALYVVHQIAERLMADQTRSV
jgi:DNA-binding NarL/FixJ family response regulator